MAVPKRKMSRSNTRNRRSQWKAKLPEGGELPRLGTRVRSASVTRARGPGETTRYRGSCHVVQGLRASA